MGWGRMLPSKRIEIMASSLELNKLLQGLEKAGVSGYTIVRNVSGKSPRGISSDDVSFNGLDNVVVIAFCEPTRLDAVIKKLTPILNKYGGECFISDALQIETIHCTST
jgi:nitrogen regulatory protein PII